MTNNTAILLFTRTAGHEALVKSFNRKKNFTHDTAIANQLISRTIKVAKETGLPLYIITDDHQTGKCFGERIANASETVFELGFEKLIIIGNDCPRLNCAIVKNAAALLQQTAFVAGGTNNGGLYLIGLTKAYFNKELFKNIEWQTKQVFTKFYEFALNVNGTINAIPTLNDVNSDSDLIHQIKLLPLFDRLKILVLSFLHKPIAFVRIAIFVHNFIFITGIISRGPPQFK